MSSDTRWQERLKQAYRNPKDLLASLDIPVHEYQHLIDTNNTFPLLVTQDFQSRMKKKNLQDPLLLQALPQLIENNTNHKFAPLERHERCVYTGIIEEYQRKDGTWDIGCNVEPHINMDNLLTFVENAKNFPSMVTLEMVKERLEYLEEGKKNGIPFITYLYNITPIKAYYKCIQVLSSLKSSLEIKQKPGSAIFI